MSVESVIEAAARDHKALMSVDSANKDEQSKAFAALKESLDALGRDVAHKAFKGERSKRKQWAELQKEITDLLEEGRGVLEMEVAPEGNWAEKMDRRYQRMQARIARLAGE